VENIAAEKLIFIVISQKHFNLSYRNPHSSTSTLTLREELVGKR